MPLEEYTIRQMQCLYVAYYDCMTE